MDGTLADIGSSFVVGIVAVDIVADRARSCPIVDGAIGAVSESAGVAVTFVVSRSMTGAVAADSSAPLNIAVADESLERQSNRSSSTIGVTALGVVVIGVVATGIALVAGVSVDVSATPSALGSVSRFMTEP